MSSQLPAPSQFTDAINDALREDVATADRLTMLVTDDVPTQFPGRLLLSITEQTPGDVEYWRTLDAAIAIEYALLHQYIHAIARAEAPLAPPAANSVYATDTVAAILDGDFLQSCAFSRLTTAIDDPALGEAAFGWISRASTECYERTIASEPSVTPSTVLAPLSGVAARIGTTLSGGSREQGKRAARAARSVAAAVPVDLPTVTTEPVDVSERTEAVRTLADAITGESNPENVTEATSRSKKARRTITELVRDHRN